MCVKKNLRDGFIDFYSSFYELNFSFDLPVSQVDCRSFAITASNICFLILLCKFIFHNLHFFSKQRALRFLDTTILLMPIVSVRLCDVIAIPVVQQVSSRVVIRAAQSDIRHDLRVDLFLR